MIKRVDRSLYSHSDIIRMSKEGMAKAVSFFDVPVGNSAILTFLFMYYDFYPFVHTHRHLKMYKIQRRHGARNYVFFDMPVST